MGDLEFGFDIHLVLNIGPHLVFFACRFWLIDKQAGK